MFVRVLATLLATCLLGCGGGGGSSGSSDPVATPVTISGTLTFASVPASGTVGAGLDFSATVAKAIRGADVQLVSANGAVLATATSGDMGQYMLTAPADTDVRVQVLARLQGNSGGSWHFAVTDNTNGNALYALQGALVNSGSVNSSRNLHALSGWDGAAYTQPRAAAPFAMLDVVYDAIQLVLQILPGTDLAPAELRWSIDNRTVAGLLADGDIGSTAYYRGANAIYVLGAADVDTDEYDRPVIAHEWAHYFVDTLSQEDSLGGAHRPGDQLDMRVAFSEGLTNALSAAILGDALYRDSNGLSQAAEFNFDIDENVVANPGWFSEASVHALLHDLFGVQIISGGAPLTGLQATLEMLTSQPYIDMLEFTSIHSFAAQLKTRESGFTSAIDALAAMQGIVLVDGRGTGETNEPSNDPVNFPLLPLYQPITIGLSSDPVCSVNDHGVYNKQGIHRFLVLQIFTTRTYLVSINRKSGMVNSTPALNIWHDKVIIDSVVGAPQMNNAFWIGQLTPGFYILDVFEDENATVGLGDVCFEVDVN